MFRSNDQVRKRFSLDDQENEMKSLCMYKNYQIYKLYHEEGVSTKNMKQ